MAHALAGDKELTMGGTVVRPARPRTLKTQLLLVFLGLAPIVALGIYAYQVGASAVHSLVASNNSTSALLTRELVEREFEHRKTALVTFAGNPDFVATIHEHDEDLVRSRLKVLVESNPLVVRAFVTDAEGGLWSDYPEAPESLGKNFSHRDWYKGLSSAWEPYVSEVYRRHAEPRPLLLAIAAPIRDTGSGQVIGAVVYQVLLEGITRLLQQIEVGRSGYVFLVDHTGTVAAHPHLDLRAREYDEYANAAPLLQAQLGEVRGLPYVEPLTKEKMLATAMPCRVGGQRWYVVAQQPLAEAYRPIRQLGIQIGGAGVLLAVVMGALFVGLAKSHERVQRMGTRLEAVNCELSRENAERRRAEQALQESHDELERRVEERTRELREKEEQFLQVQKMEAVGRLAGGVAHDFNNLLSVIIGYCDIILGKVNKNDRFREEIELIREAGDRAESLTRQLLAFSRKQVLQPAVLDLDTIVEGMDKMLRRLIGEDIELTTKLASDLDRVEADRGQIEQIIMNLAVNARDAMPRGGNLTIETANVELELDPGDWTGIRT